jgi:hypothetical protein
VPTKNKKSHDIHHNLGSILETGRERDDAYQTMQAKVRATSLKWAGEALDPPDHVPLQALPSS